MMALAVGAFIQLTQNHRRIMDIQSAEKEVRNIGNSYFYDDLDRYSVDEIINNIRFEISQSSRISALKYPETTRDAMLMVLEEYGNEKLDLILHKNYALLPEQVGGSSNFFLRLAREIDEEIEKTRKKLMKQGE
jgi:hypothetical protein